MTTENTPLEVPVAEVEVTDKFLDLAADIRLDIEQLRSQLAENKGLSKFVENDKFNVSKALKSLQNAEKLIGKRLEEADPETLSTVYEKFGVPKDASEYEVAMEGLDEEKIKSFKDFAKEAGIPKGAAQKLFEKMHQKPTEVDVVALEKEKIEKDLQSLKELFGSQMDLKRTAANKALDTFGTEELKQHIAKSGMGTDPQFIKFLADVGEKIMTKNIDAERPAAPKTSSEDARAKIAAIRNSEEYKRALKNPYGKDFLSISNQLKSLYETAG